MFGKAEKKLDGGELGGIGCICRTLKLDCGASDRLWLMRLEGQRSGSASSCRKEGSGEG